MRLSLRDRMALVAATALLAGVARAADGATAAPPPSRPATAIDAEIKAANAINRGGAAGLVRAAGQITAVDLVETSTHSKQATLTAAEKMQLAASVRRARATEFSSTTGSPWDSVYLIRTRSLGMYVAQLWDDQSLIVEVPDQLSKPDVPGKKFGVARERSEVLISNYEDFRALRTVLERRLGQPTKKEFRPPDLSGIPVTPEIKQEQERRQQSRPQDPPKEKR